MLTTQPASAAPGHGGGGAGSGNDFGADTPPPGTPPPGFGAPGAAAPEPRRGGRTALPWVVGGALTALAVLGGFIAVNLGGKDADDGRSGAGSGAGSSEGGGDEVDSGRGPAVGGGDVPREYLGAWEGEVLLDGDSIGARQRVEVRPGREGETITSMWWVLPEVMCVSDGELASTEDGLTLDVTLRDEVSQFGSGCVADQEQHLRAEDGKLFWSYEPDGLTAELEPAPVESGEHAVPPEQVGVWEPDEDYGEGIGVRVEIVRAKVGEPAVTWEMTVGDVACTWVHDVVAGDPDDDLMVTGPSRVIDESDAGACSDVYLNSLSIETEDDDQIEITPLVGSYGSEDPADFVRVD
ncbi:hypothetical protein HCN56_23900 [Streptomyces lonarensis]|uniref:Uncharacterized protein n=1 Tax=Streptomyces lonarensis TaxID=700599 RepID=A0A7X6I1N3_9ACTN|nr:hypothetical protein [Streptomyces lonarensis]